MHIALLGDSIFDNAAYTGREPDVITHLARLVPKNVAVSLLAVDGATTEGVPRQAAKVTREVTHVVLSVGGNDALMSIDLLDRPARSSGQVLDTFAERVARFEASYREALRSVLKLGRDTTVCTIYNGNLPPDQASRARMALMLFNDAILRAAFEHALRVIDLRAVCSEPSDYANPIEPSGSGGLKIAKTIARALGVIAPAPAVSSVVTR